ncbi:MAG TPA: hypothetical protein VIY48_14085 [Candidatus Paceibacterota bacterium]
MPKIKVNDWEWRQLWDEKTNLESEVKNLKAKIRGMRIARLGIAIGVVFAGFISMIAVFGFLGMLLSVSGLDKATTPKEKPASVTEPVSPSPSAQSSSPAPKSTMTTPPETKAPVIHPLSTHKSAAVGTVAGGALSCILTAKGKHYCGTPTTPRNGEACVKYSSGNTYCGTAIGNGQ